MQLLLSALAMAGGAALLQQQATLPSLVYGISVPAAALIAWLAVKSRRSDSQLISSPLRLLAFFLAGFFWAAWHGSVSLQSELGTQWYGRDVQLEGVISGMTQPFPRGTRFQFDVERAITPGARIPSRIAITWYRGANPDDLPALQAGQRWQFTVRLRPPHGNYNPHGFDLEAWLLERNIRATGYVRTREPTQLTSSMVWRPGYAVHRLREHIRENVNELLGDKPYAGILTALSVGDRGSITHEQWRVLTRTGTSHLMSISGLHVTLVAGLVFALMFRLWHRSVRLATALSPLRAATLAGLIAAMVYVALSGFAVPAQRAICMLGVIALALMAGWRAPAAAILGAALLFVLLLDPMSVTSAGFWLSFAAVAAILAATSVQGLASGPFRRFVHIQWTITVALVPLLLVLFHQVSVVSPFANAVAIPLVSLVIAPLALLLIIVPLELVAVIAHAAVVLCFSILETMSRLPGAVWQQHAPVVWTVPFALLGVGMLVLPRGFPSRWLGLVLLLPMLLVRPPKPAPGELWLTVLDVGQGLSAVIRTRNHTVLFDAGPDYTGGNDAGRRIVVPHLRGEGIRQLDMLIVSHDDNDHSGGADSVVAAQAPGSILTSIDNAGQRPGWGNSMICRAGQQWAFDGVRFEILHPVPQNHGTENTGDNDRSCVLLIDSAHGTVLLPADIEQRSERQLLARQRSRLRADVLVAPHHGSRTSSSQQFLEAVAPKFVLFPVGYRNRYGHPHPLIEARYRESGAELLRTDELGAIRLHFTSNGIEVSAWREQAARYWHQKRK